MVNMCIGVAELNYRGIASHFIPKPELPVVIGEGLTGRGGGGGGGTLRFLSPLNFSSLNFLPSSKKYLNGSGY